MADSSHTTTPTSGGSSTASPHSTPPGAAAATHAANERAVADARSAATGAEAVAEAVKKVADAAVREIERSKNVGRQDSDFLVTGNAGGRFMIDGPTRTFGTSGTVMLNGKQLHTREWSSQRIVGDLPADAKSGEVTVHVSADTVKRGYLKL